MLLRYFLLCSLVSSIIFITACSNKKADEIIPIVDSTCIPTGHIVNYTEDIKFILETHCTLSSLGTCHQSEPQGGQPGLDFTTYLGIAPEADTNNGGQLENRVLIIKDMPSAIATPPQILSSCELLKFQEWIDGGAPEN